MSVYILFTYHARTTRPQENNIRVHELTPKAILS